MEFEEIKGLGAKRTEALRKAGFASPEDLLFFFPKKYIDTDSLSNVSTVRVGDEAVFRGTLSGQPIRKNVRKGLFFVRAEFLLDDGKSIVCIWFNNAYIKSTIKANKKYFVCGRVKRAGSKPELTAPELYETSGLRIIPIYRKIAGFSQAVVRGIVQEIVKKVAVRGFLSPQICDEFGILPLNQTIKTLHAPTSMLECERARESAALQMLACDLALFFLNKDSAGRNRVFAYEDKTREISEFVQKFLPYSLTQSQQNAIEEIIASLKSDFRMNRLLQGDVGSGKTIVAFIVAYFAYLNGYQSLLMAPTEILARQHFESACKILGEAGVRVCLLTGSQGKNERADKLFGIKNGLYDFVVGTHALISDDVELSRLSLVITDEQQRFGVGQRGRLENKAEGTDCLILSATPIPRTLSLILYGELGQSSLGRIQSKNTQVFTRMVPSKKLGDMYSYIAKKAKSGQKTYIVCPRVEEDEDEALFSAKKVFAQLKKNDEIAPHLCLLHGQMKELEKTKVMEAFASGECKIMVATTVIEVGIDVADATTMVIFNPDRYGLSQLHQLRGRVGRGDIDSYCFLVADQDLAAVERLEYFLKTTDGFALAEYDFRSRGAGDFLGTRQHGGSGYNISPQIVETSRKIAQKLLENPASRQELTGLVSDDKQSYIKNLTLN